MKRKVKYSGLHSKAAAVIFAVVGFALLLQTFAATNGALGFEPEDGKADGNAFVSHDAHGSTSGDHYVTFGNNRPVEVDNSLVSFSTGLDRPASIANSGTASEQRLFIGELAGRIKIVNTNGSVAGTFLDITGSVGSGGERGLLGIVFHPGYEQNRQFYVYYTEKDGDIVVSRFLRSATSLDTADPASETKLFTIPHQEQTNHNGGGMFFGNDGFLYIATGDGGGNGPTSLDENAQDKNSLLGKILRVNVDQGSPYTAPADNPFVGADGADEVWALGLRNPWRITYDKVTGDIYIADVGENAWEEVNVYKHTVAGGANFGWGCYEGKATRRSDAECATAPANYIEPVHVYGREGGRCSIIGGYLYRGTAYTELSGQYLFADYCSGDLSTLSQGTNGAWTVTSNNKIDNIKISSFGQDNAGELYIASLENGTIYKIQATH